MVYLKVLKVEKSRVVYLMKHRMGHLSGCSIEAPTLTHNKRVGMKHLRLADLCYFNSMVYFKVLEVKKFMIIYAVSHISLF